MAAAANSAAHAAALVNSLLPAFARLHALSLSRSCSASLTAAVFDIIDDLVISDVRGSGAGGKRKKTFYSVTRWREKTFEKIRKQ